MPRSGGAFLLTVSESQHYVPESLYAATRVAYKSGLVGL